MRTFRVFDPKYELFVFDPQDEPSLMRCARDFNFSPDDFGCLHFSLGDLVVLEPLSYRRVELRLVSAPDHNPQVGSILASIRSVTETTLAVIEAACATKQGVKFRVLVDGRLWWCDPRGILPINFWEEPF